MEFDLEGPDLSDAYRILTAVVSPRPIAWVSTLSSTGVTNLAPFSFFNVFGTKPPIVAFAPGNRSDGSPKDTAKNIIDTGEFVINMVSVALAQDMVDSSIALPPETSEIDIAKIVTVPSRKVVPPRVQASPASLECKLFEVKQIGENRMIIGTVVQAHIEDQLFDSNLEFNQEMYSPLGRMASPSWYTQTSSLLNVTPKS